MAVLSQAKAKLLNRDIDGIVNEFVWRDFVANAMDPSSGKLKEDAKEKLRTMVRVGWDNPWVAGRGSSQDSFMEQAISGVEQFYALKPRAVVPALPVKETTAPLRHLPPRRNPPNLPNRRPRSPRRNRPPSWWICTG